jgi:dTDP-4-amino-4,6-dideoxygalactose transaminase|tara:strand:+ start:280 stop:1380 length:1101 start_codon:yes stop_codon:yes gene_type:complete
MKIPYVNLKLQYKSERKRLLKAIDKTLLRGDWVGGDEVQRFENNISKQCKVKYCVALNSGTDALTLSLHLLGVRRGDEVITPPNSFIASTATIIHLGAKPVFVDVKDDQSIDENKIEEKITKKTKVIMPVHLTGRMCNMEKIVKIAKKYKLNVIEDSAQSIMSKFKNKFSGAWGDVGCFSAHPLKNLNAMGDAGYLTTNNKYLYSKIKNLRSHGMEKNRNNIEQFGYVSRMDNIQATILNFRLKNLKYTIEKRRNNYNLYKKYLNRKIVFFPEENINEFNTYHTFVVQVDQRDKLKSYLASKGVGTAIHYPMPIHLQKAAKFLKYKRNDFPNCETQANRIITLPINQYLTNKEIIHISNLVNNFYK